MLSVPENPGRKEITVRPDLNEADLGNTIEKLKKYLVQLYSTCEIDFINTLKVFEALVFSQVEETQKKQTDNLKAQMQK